MTLLELVMLIVALGTIAALVTAAIAALRGRPRAAARLLAATALALTAYLTVGLAVSYARPQRLIALGEPWCFDDWCLAVDRVGALPTEGGTRLTVDLRLTSRAGRVRQRANGAWIYLLGADGARYPPDADPSAVPLDVELGPGEVRPTARSFTLPSGVTPVGVVTGHGGPYCGPFDYLVIGNAGCTFGRPTMIALPRGVTGIP